MAHFDLYGNSYRTELEAMNAEMAQCAQIDSAYREREIKELEEREQRHAYQLGQWQDMVTERLERLERWLPVSLCEGEGK